MRLSRAEDSPRLLRPRSSAGRAAVSSITPYLSRDGFVDFAGYDSQRILCGLSVRTQGGSSMTTVMRLLAATLLTVPVLAADTPRFAQWKAAELKQHEAALSKKVG